MNPLTERLALTYMRRSPIDFGKSTMESRVATANKPSPLHYKTPDGITFSLDLSDHVMRQIYLKGSYEQNTQRHLFGLVEPWMTFFDVGANVGSYSLPLARRLDAGHVYSFEPNPPAIELLKKNISLNSYRNIDIVEVGVSNEVGHGRLDSLDLTTASLHSSSDAARMIDIQLTTIDAFCEQQQIETVEVMKIDIEGHELSALAGAHNLLERSKKMVLVVEVDGNCEKAGHSRNELLRQIVGHGFKAFLPRAWPRRLQPITGIASDYTDNVVFLKGHE